MKKIYPIISAIFLGLSVFAQSPESFKYQAVVRNATGEIIATQQVGVQISILQTSTTGTAVYVEAFTPTTNSFGLINLEIGNGTVVSGDFSTIDWSAGTYFIKVELDAAGGTSYEEMGTSQLLSVPFALHAKTAANTFSGNYSDLTGTPNNVSTFTNDAGYLTSISETDPVFGAHAASGITSTNITNWTTAFGWGDHSAADYLTSYTETDPVFGAHAANGITSTNITNWNTAYGWSDHSAAGYLSSYTETDSLFLAHTAFGIGSTDLTNWNTAYGWGDHSTANYLTSYTETDPIFMAHPSNGITSTNITNWTTAYGWGNHAGLYKTISYVPAWNEISSNPFSITSPEIDQLLKFNGTNWVNFTPSYLTSYTETDPVWTTASIGYYTKTNLQTDGQAQLHWNNIINKPVFFSGSFTLI